MERRCCIRLLLILGGILAVPSAHADDARIPATRAELLDPVWIEDALAELGIERLVKEYDGHADPLVQQVQDALVLAGPSRGTAESTPGQWSVIPGF